MALIKGIFLSLFGLALTYIAYVAFHTGAFQPVEINLYDGPAMTVIYKERTGPYHEIAKDISKVEKHLAEFNVDCRRSFGRFFDDPDLVEEDRLRSEVGCITIGGQPSTEKEIHKKDLPSQKYVRATFSGSPAIGPFKVYPKVNDFIKEKRMKQEGPVIEIYTMHSGDKMTTEYLFPVAGQ